MFKLKLWFRRLWRRKFGEPVHTWNKNAKYLEAFPWLAALVPLRGYITEIKIQRAEAGTFNSWASGCLPYWGHDLYLADPKGKILASVRHVGVYGTWKERLFRRRDVYETLADLGGFATVIKYVVLVDWARDHHGADCEEAPRLRSRHVRITLFKFPAGAIPFDYATGLLQESETKWKKELERRRMESAKTYARQDKEATDQFKAELATVAD